MNRAGIAVILIALAACAFGISRRASDPFNVSELLDRPGASAEWTSIAGDSLRRVTRDTRFKSRWQINRAPTQDLLTVVLVDSDRLRPGQLAPAAFQNCTFTGTRNLIICDVALIRRFLAVRDLDKRIVTFDGDVPTGMLFPLEPLPADELRNIRFQMMEWILGHEIGHILNGDGATHFADGRLDSIVRPATLSQAREIAADGFLARAFPDANGGQDMRFYQFLIGILQNEINRKACPDRSPLQECPNIQTGVLIFSPTDYLRYSRKGSHPEYVIRMVRLLSEADTQHGLGIVGHLVGQIKSKLLAEDAPAAPSPVPKS